MSFTEYVTSLFPDLIGLPPIEQGFIFMIGLYFVALAFLATVVAFRSSAGGSVSR